VRSCEKDTRAGFSHIAYIELSKPIKEGEWIDVGFEISGQAILEGPTKAFVVKTVAISNTDDTYVIDENLNFGQVFYNKRP